MNKQVKELVDKLIAASEEVGYCWGCYELSDEVGYGKDDWLVKHEHAKIAVGEIKLELKEKLEGQLC